VSSAKRSQTADIWRKRSFTIRAAARCFQGNGDRLAQTIATSKNLHTSNMLIFLRCWSNSTFAIRYETILTPEPCSTQIEGALNPHPSPKWNRLVTRNQRRACSRNLSPSRNRILVSWSARELRSLLFDSPPKDQPARYQKLSNEKLT